MRQASFADLEHDLDIQRLDLPFDLRQTVLGLALHESMLRLDPTVRLPAKTAVVQTPH